jgi:hypothetical protein
MTTPRARSPASGARASGSLYDPIMMIGIVAVVLILSPSGTVIFSWISWRRYRRISITPAVTCAQLERSEDPPRWVTVAAHTGGRELLRAPRSGRECVWFQVDYARNLHDEGRATRWLDLPEATSLVPITDGTATAYLTPQLALTRLTGPALAEVTMRGRDDDVSWREVIVPPEVPVFVQGRPVRTERIRSLQTIVGEDRPWWPPASAFRMGTQRTAEPAGVVLETGWLEPCGVSLLSAEETRHRFAINLRCSLAVTLGLPLSGHTPAGYRRLGVPHPLSVSTRERLNP